MRKFGKKSLIAGILAMGFVLAGTGYAYWTDTLNITTKATTGDFGVKFADLGLYAQYGNETIPGGGWSIVDGVGDKGFVDDTFFMRGNTDYNKIAKDGSVEQYKKDTTGYNNVDFNAKLVNPETITNGPRTYVHAKGSDQIELDIQRMYPGYAQAFRSDIVNVGDIAARLSNLKFSIDRLDGHENGNLEDMLGIAILIKGEQYNPKVNPDDWNVFKLADSLNDDSKTFTVGNVQFVRLSALKNADFKDALEKNVILCNHYKEGGDKYNDNRMDIFLGVAMDPDAEGKYTTGSSKDLKNNDDTQSQKKGVKVLIDLLWDQFNEGKNVDKGNILVNQNN